MDDCLSTASMASTRRTSFPSTAIEEDDDSGEIRSLADEVSWDVSFITMCTSTVCTLHTLTTSDCHHWEGTTANQIVERTCHHKGH